MHRIPKVAAITTMLLVVTCSAPAELPMHRIADMLPVTGCRDLTLSPDGTLLYAHHTFGSNNNGYRVFKACLPFSLQDEGCALERCNWTSEISADASALWMDDFYGDRVMAYLCDAPEDPFVCQEIASVSVGSCPGAVLFDDVKRYLYVAVNQPGTNAIGWISIVDTTTESVVETIDLNGEPGRLAKAPGDPYVYTITRNPGTERLYRISTETHEIVGTCDLFGIPPYDPGFSVAPDGSVLYVPSYSLNAVLVLEPPAPDSCAIVDSIPVDQPAGAFVAPDGAYLIVMQPLESQISFVELPSGSHRQTFAISHNDGKRTPIWTAEGHRVFVPIGQGGDGRDVIVFETASCPADLNGDGYVDLSDLALLLSYYGMACP